MLVAAECFDIAHSSPDSAVRFLGVICIFQNFWSLMPLAVKAQCNSLEEVFASCQRGLEFGLCGWMWWLQFKTADDPELPALNDYVDDTVTHLVNMCIDDATKLELKLFACEAACKSGLTLCENLHCPELKTVFNSMASFIEKVQAGVTAVKFECMDEVSLAKLM